MKDSVGGCKEGFVSKLVKDCYYQMQMYPVNAQAYIIVAGLLSAAEVEYHLFDICSMILWIRRKNSSLFLHSQS